MKPKGDLELPNSPGGEETRDMSTEDWWNHLSLGKNHLPGDLWLAFNDKKVVFWKIILLLYVVTFIHVDLKTDTTKMADL